MIFEKELSKVKNSPGYIDYKEENIDSYLSSVFILKAHIQFDFYNPEKDKLTSFTVKPNGIDQQESEVFRKEKKEIKELKLENIKINLENIKKIMSQLLEKYKEVSKKEFIILQNEDSPIWNISYLTDEFKLLHVKVNANSGKIVHESIESVLNFKA